MRNLIIVLLSCLLFSCIRPESSIQKFDFSTQWDTIRVLKNPYKGWYHHLLDNGIYGYSIKNDSVFTSFPGMDHLYLRLAWSYLEPEEGQYDWHRIDEIVEKYVPLGYKISFRISCKETGTYPETVNEQVDGVQYATPYWVKKAGAKGTVAENGGIKSWVPAWGDPVYLQKLDQFHRVFAAKYDGQPWIRYVDIGSIGEWGEGHTSSSTKIPPTVTEVKANIDVFLKNYKKSQLVCTDDLLYYGKTDVDVKTLFDYAIAKGISLRDDSPIVDWYVQHNLKTWTVSHPHFYDPLYLKKPIVFELQHYGEVKKDGNWLGKNGAGKIAKYGYSGAEIMRKAIETMHATYIGYHGYAEDWLADNPDLTKELANLCGYWYFPVKANLPGKFSKGDNIFTIEWLNKGVAPAYNTFGLALRFESKNPEKSFDLFLYDSGNKNWLPGINKEENYRVKIPSEVKKGDYVLKFKLMERIPESDRDIQIGIKASIIDSQDYTKIGKISIR
jgi:hypothetical protein